MKKKFYVTTAIPYVNAAPHIGFALEIVQADVIARYQRLLGKDVFFLTGSDENSLKNVQAAEEKNIPVQKLVDENAFKFRDLKDSLALSFDDFIKTTEKRHMVGVQALWGKCQKTDIYKKAYQGLYCTGCETFYTPKDLVDGKCPEHKTKPEVIEEENYFFRLSRYQNWLEKIISEDELLIIPNIRKNEILSFIRRGLEDFSISRSHIRAHGWGIPVPGDRSQIIYVWFDALSNYINALDWHHQGKLFKKYWPADVHVIGKGITRFHAIYWPAMLKSAGLAIPKSIFAHGYVTAEGQKISKSIGNVIDPFDLVKKFGTDPIRYYLLREIPAYDDGDFSISRFKELYNADLANGLGNLVSRVAKLCEKSGFGFSKKVDLSFDKYVIKLLNTYRFGDALARIWEHVHATDRIINEQKPWAQKGETLKKSLQALVTEIQQIAFNLKPFLPQTAAKIEDQFKGPRIKSAKSLFPRLEETVLPQKPASQKGEIVIGKIVGLTAHPNADKLQVVKVDVGQPNLLTIVCGGQNIEKDQIIPMALPGSNINQPDGEKLKVKKTNIRGIKSEGVICSKLEAGTGSEYEKIWILPKTLETQLGQPLPKC